MYCADIYSERKVVKLDAILILQAFSWNMRPNRINHLVVQETKATARITVEQSSAANRVISLCCKSQVLFIH